MNSMRRWLWAFAGMMLLLGAGWPGAADAADDEKPPVTAEELLGALIRHHAVEVPRLDVNGCRMAMRREGRATVGDYLAFLVSRMDPKNGGSGVASGCQAAGADGRRICEVTFQTGAGTESLWHYGLRFTLDRRGKIDPRTLACPGAGS